MATSYWTLITLAANTAQRVLTDNPHRLSFTLKNDSDTDIRFGFSDQLALTGRFSGEVVDPNGGSATNRWHKGEVWCICAGAKDITVEESNESGIAGPTKWRVR